tara:strand:- start:1033 stop:2109 length:1077 start_codon:yes stop_codon:yes gene_type:complete
VSCSEEDNNANLPAAIDGDKTMTNSKDKVRIGIIRCDTHAFWYAHLFERPDPELMRLNHRGCHYYFHEPDNPCQERFAPPAAMAITRVFDPVDPAAAKTLSETFGGRPRVCDSVDEASDDVDLVYVADCDYGGEDHLELARPGLTKGVPHFIDKPFAHTLADARAMIALAQAHDTVLMCASLMSYSPHLERFRGRFADIAPVRSVVVYGGWRLAILYHVISLIQNVMGPGCEWVECMGPDDLNVIRLHYPNGDGGTDAIILNSIDKWPGRHDHESAANVQHCRMDASAYGDGGAIHSPRVGDYLVPYAGLRIVQMADRMARSGVAPIPYAEMLEPMAIIEAARLGRRAGRRVALEEVQ